MNFKKQFSIARISALAIRNGCFFEQPVNSPKNSFSLFRYLRTCMATGDATGDAGMGDPHETKQRFRFVLDEAVSLLVIDDDPIQREFSQVYLASPVAEVHTVESAEEALSALEAQPFDIALVDVDLDGMDGISLVRQLRADHRFDDMAIMVITGREDMASIDAAFDAGATSFAVKPMNWRLLSHQIKFLLRAHRALGGATAHA
jgi:CheY-like chemotaxis protein